MKTRLFQSAVLMILGTVFGSSVALAERVIVRTAKPYTSVKQRIAALGGTVTYEFKHANGLAATVPDDKVDLLKSIPGVQYTVRDVTIPNPEPKEVVDLSSEVAAELPSDAIPATTIRTTPS